MLLDALYQNLAPYLKAKRWVVAFSGGMDSTVLLHLLAKLKAHYALPELSAVHIHHGLQTIADNWPDHCQRICNCLTIPLTVIKVAVTQQASIEQAAREARYKAFANLLNADDLLITAQHKNDQAETLLFRLFRGAGLRGLTAMPKQRPLGLATLVRPLLNTTYDTLKKYALDNHLQWIEDPTNQNTKYARNYLRHEVIPKITQHWPQAINTIAQTCEHLQEAQLLLNTLAEQDLVPAQAETLYPWLAVPNLLIAPLINLSNARQKNLLSLWLSSYTLQPTTQHWQSWFDFITAKDTANPIWQLHNAELHRGNGRIWLLAGHWLTKLAPLHMPVTTCPSITLPNNGAIKLSSNISQHRFYITYRQGGESIFLPKRGHRDLKKLFNEASIPYFLRHRIPLLVDQQSRLVAVANFPQWVSNYHEKDFTFEWITPNFNS